MRKGELIAKRVKRQGVVTVAGQIGYVMLQKLIDRRQRGRVDEIVREMQLNTEPNPACEIFEIGSVNSMACRAALAMIRPGGGAGDRHAHHRARNAGGDRRAGDQFPCRVEPQVSRPGRRLLGAGQGRSRPCGCDGPSRRRGGGYRRHSLSGEVHGDREGQLLDLLLPPGRSSRGHWSSRRWKMRFPARSSPTGTISRPSSSIIRRCGAISGRRSARASGSPKPVSKHSGLWQDLPRSPHSLAIAVGQKTDGAIGWSGPQ